MQTLFGSGGPHGCSSDVQYFRCHNVLCYQTLRRTRELSQWTVVMGQTEMANARGVTVDQIVVHKDYSRLTNDFDIAMLKLTWPVTLKGTSIHSAKLLLIISIFFKKRKHLAPHWHQ